MPIAGPTLERPIKLARLLEVGLRSKPNETALVSLERKWSWRELDQASTRLAGQYLALGLAPGDRVASLMPNRGALLVHYLACFKAGLAATPLNYRYQAPEIDHALEVSGASLLVAHAERDDVLAASKRVCSTSSWAASATGPRAARHRQLEELMTVDGPRHRLAAAARRDARVYLFHVGQHGQAERGDAYARHLRLDRGQRRSPVSRSRQPTFSCRRRRPLTSPHPRSRSPGWLPGPVSRSRDRSAATKCCRCSAARDRRCCACCRPRCSAWCATTERRGKISNPFGGASPAATRSRRSWSASSWT